jgi:hypothetical protein
MSRFRVEIPLRSLISVSNVEDDTRNRRVHLKIQHSISATRLHVRKYALGRSYFPIHLKYRLRTWYGGEMWVYVMGCIKNSDYRP